MQGQDGRAWNGHGRGPDGSLSTPPERGGQSALTLAVVGGLTLLALVLAGLLGLLLVRGDWGTPRVELPGWGQEEPEPPISSESGGGEESQVAPPEGEQSVTLRARTDGEATVHWGVPGQDRREEVFTGEWSLEVPLPEGRGYVSLFVVGKGGQGDETAVECELLVAGQEVAADQDESLIPSAQCGAPVEPR